MLQRRELCVFCAFRRVLPKRGEQTQQCCVSWIIVSSYKNSNCMSQNVTKTLFLLW